MANYSETTDNSTYNRSEFVGTKGFTGNPYIDGILWGGNYWLSNSSPKTITYSFWNSGTESFDDPFGDLLSFADDWFPREKASMVAALNSWAAVADIQFVDVGDDNKFAMFGFYNFQGSSDWLGAFYPPGTEGMGIGYFNWRGLGWDAKNGMLPGDYGFVTLIHELGHGLGLAHPHDDGGGSSIYPGVTSPDDTGDYGLNQGIYTTMSYNSGLSASGEPVTQFYGFEGTPMAFDIAAIQHLYGANLNYKKGNDIYFLPTVNQWGTGYTCIWDTAGIDTISGAGATLGVTINLNDASLNVAVDEAGAGGYLSSAKGILGGFTIANTVVIENAIGSSFADSMTGNEFTNVLRGEDGEDELHGLAGNDSLIGGTGNDTLDGGIGQDSMIGGSGDDTYYVDQTSDICVENAAEGSDRVYSTSREYRLRANLEELYLLGTGNINGIGNDENNYIEGNAGRNTIDGRGGADTMAGGAGADTYYIDDPGDVIVETLGSDRNVALFTPNLGLFPEFTSFTLPDAVYNLRILGAGNLNGTGNSLSNFLEGNSVNNILKGEGSADYIYGLAGNDTLDGGAGNDNLDGGVGADTYITSPGNDTYVVNSVQDVVVGNTGGSHKVLSSVSYDLLNNAPGVRHLILTGTANINALGTTIGSVLTGNGGKNQLTGRNGNDSLYGNGGDDLLTGGMGNDVLNGQAGADQFRFSVDPASPFSSMGVDTIGDFKAVQGDKIQLSKANFTVFSSRASGTALSATEFATVTADNLVGTSTAMVVYSTGSGRLFYNPDGAVAGFGAGGVFARLAGTPALAATDIVIGA